MSKRLILVLALAFVVGMAFTAFAEVQNVKVSGDLTMMGIARDNMDLAKTRMVSVDPSDFDRPEYKSDKYRNAISIVRVRVDADLTDNVSTTVRLLNERVWGAEGDTHGSTSIDLDLAYATLKEFLYSPLTMTVGRQELHFGTDLIIGDPDTNNTASSRSNLPEYEKDLSLRKSFDAVRATLNYDPLVVDVIWAKPVESSTTSNDDTTLSGINANYALDKQTTLEGYFFSKIKGTDGAKLNSDAGIAGRMDKADKVFTVGGRIANSSVKNLSLGLESAFQFGNYNPAFDINTIADTATRTARSVIRRAWALEATANYDLKDISMISKYAPSVGAVYAYFSGDNAHQKTDSKGWRGWDPMYENKTYGHLANALFDLTNMSILGVNGKMKIVDDVTFNIAYLFYWLNKPYRGGSIASGDLVYLKNNANSNQYRMTHDVHLGQEVDAKVTYDYTEDVQFSLLAGVFMPGSAFDAGSASDTQGNRSTAGEVIGSMKVTF
jgi:hypothetical protein